MGRLVALVAAGICVGPAVGVVARALDASPDAWAHVTGPILWRYLSETAVVALAVAALTLLLGTTTAWLAVMCRFPGRRALEWALILPLAAPAYVIAFAWSDLTGPGGPLPALGLPHVRGIGGAVFVFTVTLYPYVYLAARSAFLSQSVCALEAARTLGCSVGQSFWRAGVPLARPALAAGTALAVMEAMADFGAVDHLGVTTLTVGVYRTWFSLGDPGAAARLGLGLMGLALLLVLLERQTRSTAGYASISTRWRDLPRFDLGGWRGQLAAAWCATPVVLGFAVPAGWLAARAVSTPQSDPDGLLRAAGTTVGLATTAALLIVLVAVALAAAARDGNRPSQLALRAANASYAAPGLVLALGALWAMQGVFAQRGIVGGVAILALLWAYTARFAAAGTGPVEAALDRVSANMRHAARTLGASRWQRVARLEAPLAAPGLLVGLLLVFVEVMKELPATLVLRPFNLDTLAVRAYAFAGDERLAEAALPALLVVVTGLAPVLWLSRRIAGSRPGAALGTMEPS